MIFYLAIGQYTHFSLERNRCVAMLILYSCLRFCYRFCCVCCNSRISVSTLWTGNARHKKTESYRDEPNGKLRGISTQVLVFEFEFHSIRWLYIVEFVIAAREIISISVSIVYNQFELRQKKKTKTKPLNRIATAPEMEWIIMIESNRKAISFENWCNYSIIMCTHLFVFFSFLFAN